LHLRTSIFIAQKNLNKSVLYKNEVDRADSKMCDFHCEQIDVHELRKVKHKGVKKVYRARRCDSTSGNALKLQNNIYNSFSILLS
jgi:hypothetical protein